MADNKEWIDTPGLEDVLEQEVPLARKLLVDGTYPILVRGAPRIGKSHIRDRIWELSKLKKLKEGVINCAAIPRDLIESVLFGHKKGAFTGAVSDRPGLLFDDSDPPRIVFLEEIGELPKYVQAKLLVFFDTGSIMPVGANWGEGGKSTLRVIATSNAENNKFRPDFLARFWEITIPPIHKRREDVPYFLNLFLKGDEQELTVDELYYLMNYNWPGGVTEIEKVCVRTAHYCFSHSSLERSDFVRELISNISYHDAWYPYAEFCHYLVLHEEDDLIRQLFPHFCIGGLSDNIALSYEIDDLIREWRAWCYFFWHDPKSPSSINENFKESIVKSKHRRLLFDWEHREGGADRRYAFVSQLGFFVDFLKSKKLWNKEGRLLLNNLRSRAFEDFYNWYNPDKEDENQEEPIGVISFEQTCPTDYRDQFWEYQVKLGRTGREVKEIYGINKKTAERNIRERKQKL